MKRKKVKKRREPPPNRPKQLVKPTHAGDTPQRQMLKVIPFSSIRDAPHMPFRPGQGVTLVGWQFEILAVMPDGTIGLRPVGRIVPDDKTLVMS
jgi:hypothetical protein